MLSVRRTLFAPLLLALAAPACAPPKDAPPDSSLNLPDGGNDVDAGVEETVYPSVRFNPIARFVDESGAVYSGQAGAWLGFGAPAALIPDAMAAGGFRSSLAIHAGIEGYVIPNVPEAAYYLRFNDTYVWSDARQQDLVSTLVQRHDLDWSVPTGTGVQLHVTGLAPWKASDMLRLSSPNGGTPMEDRRLVTPEDFGGTAPTVGATQLDVRFTRFLTLLEGGKGDSLWVQQLSERPAVESAQPYTATVRSFRQPAFSLVARQVAPLDAPLEGGTERHVSFAVNVAAFDTVAQGAHPAAKGPRLGRTTGHFWAIGARPGAEPFARLGANPELAFAPVSIDLERAQYEVSFLDAFPQEWRRVMMFSTGAMVSYGTAENPTLHPFLIQRYDTLDDVPTGAPLAPRLGAPRNLRVNGAPASGTLTGIGRSPVVSWDPPALGTPTRYFVELLTYAPGRNLSSTGKYLITGGTELRLPAEVVPTDSGFVIKVVATRNAGTRSPYEGELPLDLAEAATGLLTP